MDSAVSNFFYPESIAIIGASGKEKSIGYEILKNIRSYGYRGGIYPVNPKQDQIFGYRCYPSIAELPEIPSLALIVIPKQFVEETVEKVLAKGIKSILLITAGFRETGKEGEELENRIFEKIKTAGARLVGPNCMGLVNTLSEVKLNATFVAEQPESGSTAFFSQSGALGAAVLNSLRETDIRFGHFISAGNKTDLNENDLLDFWMKDSRISSLTFYLESFVNGLGFVRKCVEHRLKKPVIILKAGKTSGGMKAASSHTGALSSDNNVVDAILKQFGIIRVDNINDLFNTAKGFDNFPIPAGKNIAIVTNAGGPAILAVDSLEKNNLSLAVFSYSTTEKLKEIVNPEGSLSNPVDLLPGATPETYRNVVETIAADPAVDAIISIFVQPVMVNPFEVSEAVYGIKTQKPILQVDMPLPEFWEEYRLRSKKHLPLFRNPEDPALVLGNMLKYHAAKEKIEFFASEYLSMFGEFTAYGKAKSGFLTPEQFYQLSYEKGFPYVESVFSQAASLDEVDIENFPVVLKGLNKEIVHKSEIGAVVTEIADWDELKKEAAQMKTRFREFGFELESFQIQKFVKGKQEILIGAVRDKSFGPVIMFGTGGKYVEVICDTAIRSAYMVDEDINELIYSTNIGRIIGGVRGERPVDIRKLRRLIRNVAEFVRTEKNISELDFNPLILTKNDDFIIVDARIRYE